MTGIELIKQLRSQGLLDQEVLVNVLMLDGDEPEARNWRFHITSVGHGLGEDNLDSNYGPANEINIHQNESLLNPF